MDFGDVVAARSTQQPASGRRPSGVDVSEIWKAAAADALAAEPPPPKTGWDSVVHKRGKNPSRRTEQVHRFGSFRTYFRLHGSAIFHKSVVGRSLVAAAMAESAYYANMINPDRGIDNISPFYFTVMGTCLSFVLVFKSNIAYNRFWEARGHAGSVCHCLRGMMRSLVFATNVTAGRDTPAVYAVQRYCNAFFALMLQDVRMNQDLSEIPSALLTESEKQELISVRRRPLMVLGWIQLTLRDVKRRVDIDMVQSNKFEETLDVLSAGYHGCTKIVSQPLPFAYEQLIAMLTQLYCFTVPVCFITSFGFYIFVPAYLISNIYFGIMHIGHELADPFGTDPNDVNLEVLQQQIIDDLETYVLKWLALPPPPPPPAPPALPVKSLAEAGSEVRRDYETSSDAGMREGQDNRETSCSGLQQRADSLALLRERVEKRRKPKPCICSSSMCSSASGGGGGGGGGSFGGGDAPAPPAWSPVGVSGSAGTVGSRGGTPTSCSTPAAENFDSPSPSSRRSRGHNRSHSSTAASPNQGSERSERGRCSSRSGTSHQSSQGSLRSRLGAAVGDAEDESGGDFAA